MLKVVSRACIAVPPRGLGRRSFGAHPATSILCICACAVGLVHVSLDGCCEVGDPCM